MKILLRPVEESSRRIISSLVAPNPALSSSASRSGFGATENSPSIEPRSAPDLSEVAGEAAANQHAERVDDDRLPGSGLTREQIETTLKLNLHVIDQELCWRCSGTEASATDYADFRRQHGFGNATARCDNLVSVEDPRPASLERVPQRELHYASGLGFIQRSLS